MNDKKQTSSKQRRLLIDEYNDQNSTKHLNHLSALYIQQSTLQWLSSMDSGNAMTESSSSAAVERGEKVKKVTRLANGVQSVGTLKKVFESMISDFSLSHSLDHAACMVDMLGRHGFLAEAKELAGKYSMTRNVKASSWEALLGACFSHGEVEMGTDLGEALKVLVPQKEMSYVLQSNLYCSKGKWEEAEIVRKAMADEGLKKMPGCSWIEVINKVTAFVAGHY